MTNSGVVVAKGHTNISLSQGGSAPSYLLACKASNMLGFAPANVESTSCCVFIIQLYGPFILVHMDSLSVLTSQAALYPPGKGKKGFYLAFQVHVSSGPKKFGAAFDSASTMPFGGVKAGTFLLSIDRP